MNPQELTITVPNVLLVDDETASMPGLKQVAMVVHAYSTDDDSDSPDFAVIHVSELMLSKLESLANLCEACNLSQVRKGAYPQWGPGDIETELRLQHGELVVMRGGTFFYTDFPAHQGGHIETNVQDISQIRKEFESAADGAVVFLTTEKWIKESYLANMAAQGDEHDEAGELDLSDQHPA